jgi:hypothetical protein
MSDKKRGCVLKVKFTPAEMDKLWHARRGCRSVQDWARDVLVTAAVKSREFKPGDPRNREQKCEPSASSPAT